MSEYTNTFMTDRRRFLWRVLLLFSVVAVAGTICLSLYVHTAMKKTVGQRKTIAKIESLGGYVLTQFGGSGDNWIRRNLVENSVFVVNLSDTQFSDVSHLKELKGLIALDVSGTEVTDLTPIVNLERLNWLSVANTPVSDLTPISKLRLHFLDIAGTEVTDIAMLKDMRFLEEVDLSNSKIPSHQVDRLKQSKPDLNVILNHR